VSALSDSPFASQDVYELRHVDAPHQLILQKVTLEEQPGQSLFALYRPFQLSMNSLVGLVRIRTSHDLVYPLGGLADNSYEVVSMVPHFSAEMLRQAGSPRPAPPWLAFWQVPDQLRPVLAHVRREVERLYHPASDYDRVESCVRYLTDPQRFAYTLDLPDYGNGDPVASFLTETRRGSCEQFASALALMLRMWSIPTRLVVGYKDGTYNPSDQSYVFRDRDAHAWVEVYFNKLGWVEFDPTPGSVAGLLHQQAANTAVPGLFERLRGTVTRLFLYTNMNWNIHVLGYSREQQKAFVDKVGTAARGLAQDATSLLRAIWPGLPDLGFLQVALVVVAVTFVGISLYLAAGWLERAIMRRRRQKPLRTVRFYEELLSIMRRKGLRRPPHQTPREFARAAAARLGAEGSDVEGAVNLVTDLYYRVRFGGHAMDAAERAQTRQALHTLKSIRHPRRRPPGQPAAPD
jgi:hypothetical protein